MTTNGTPNGTVAQNGDSFHDTSLQWRVGLMNKDNKYLTAESFGGKINASGTSLKKKQIWILEQDTVEEIVYLRSHMQKYISTDKYGKVMCDTDQEERDAAEKWVVEYSPDGRWAFRNSIFGTYLGGTEDSLHCSSKTPSASEWWTLHLDIHPQVNLRNLNRKRYARLNNDELQCTEIVPWSEAALILLEFRSGLYALKSSDNRYLHRDGTLVDDANDDTLYTLEIKSGQNSGFAFRDREGKYLTAVGHTATLKSRNKVVTKDEIFTVEDSHPQATVTSILTGKRTTIKQGDLTSVRDNQQEVESNEIFQIEYDKKSNKWAFRSLSNSYWTTEKTGIKLTQTLTQAGYYDLTWQSDGTVTIKASNDRYVYAMANGSLKIASSEIPDDDDKLTSKEYRFRMTLVNRPLLVLKGIHGFVGYRMSGKPELSCNKGSFDPIVLIAGNQSGYYIKGNGTNNKYWCVSTDDGSLSASSEKPIRFHIEFAGQSQLAIKAQNGCYITGEQNGTFTAKATSIDAASLWEY